MVVTLINTKGSAFIGPGSEWFWAALQFIALAITFIAIYRQLRIARSARAVEQVTAYTDKFEDERMYRYQLAILVALRDGVEIPDAAGSNVSNYFETLGLLTRRGHIDVKLLWGLFTHVTAIWWAALDLFVQRARTEGGHAIFQDFEWLVEAMAKMDRRQGGLATVDAAWVANWLRAAIERLEDTIRVEQALRSVVIAPSESLDTARSAAPPSPSAEKSGQPEVRKVRNDDAPSAEPSPSR
jgi:hypothetical protein